MIRDLADLWWGDAQDHDDAACMANVGRISDEELRQGADFADPPIADACLLELARRKALNA